jgi:hypothetical protein
MEKSFEYEVLAPGVCVYKNVLKEDWKLTERIETALSLPGTRFSWRNSQVGFGDTISDLRRCKDFKVDERVLGPIDSFSSDLYEVHKQIITTLKSCVEHYRSKYLLGPIEYFECVNVVKYGKGEFFKQHADDGYAYRCILSAVGYPNDNYEGGALVFPNFGVTYTPSAGDFVLFPSNFVYSHIAEPVLDDGVKYSFVVMMDRNAYAHAKDTPTALEKING